MAHYADTSFLVSLYVRDAFSVPAQAWLTTHRVALPLTEFGRTELRNALTRLAFTGTLTAPQLAAAWQLVETDLNQGASACVRPGVAGGVCRGRAPRGRGL